jgi:hypothetical protein
LSDSDNNERKLALCNAASRLTSGLEKTSCIADEEADEECNNEEPEVNKDELTAETEDEAFDEEDEVFEETDNVGRIGDDTDNAEEENACIFDEDDEDCVNGAKSEVSEGTELIEREAKEDEDVEEEK